MIRMVFGVEALDKLFKDFLVPPTTIVVAGHPGAGKTTLASTICYTNTLNGYRCLYISFQEDREKLFKNMAGVGIDLRFAEEKNLLMFVKLPIALDLEKVVEQVNNAITSFNPNIIVIDSINAMLLASPDESRRAWIQNYLYELAKYNNSVVILVAELPIGVEQLGLGSLEFVVDAVVILKHRVEDGKILRVMEIRKIRGAPLTLAEIPFAIIPGLGLKLYTPIMLDELAAEGEPVKNPCKLLDTAVGIVRRGHVNLILYPVWARPPEVFLLIYGYALINNAKTLLISFRTSPKTVREIMVNSLKSLGIPIEKAEKFIDNSIVFKSVNPYTLSSTELTAHIIELVNNLKPEVVIFHALDIFALSTKPKYFPILYNILNYLKHKNILTFIMSVDVDSDIRTAFMRLSDIIIRFKYRYTDSFSKMVLIWRREKDPFIGSEAELRSCRDDIAKISQ